MDILWHPIYKCDFKEGETYLVSGWEDNNPGKDRWYAVVTYSRDAWYDENTLDELYDPTHFSYFNPVPEKE